jgi:ATP-dependent Clp protease protease subunit
MLPESIENLNLPDPSLVTYYRNLEQRKIWLDSALDINWLEYGRMIMEWNREDKGLPVEDRVPIKLYFFSPGGDLDINNFFIDVIKLSKTPIFGINVGIAFSGGAFTYLACHKRYVFPYGSFLLHKGSAEGISGTAQQIEEYANQYKKQIKALKDYLIERGLPKKLVDSKMRGEWYIDANEAVELGIAHGVVSDMDDII